MKTKILLLGTGLMTAVICYCQTSGTTAITKEVKDNSAVQSSGDATVIKKYPVKSGIVIFETVIAGKKGKEILYFEDYGLKELVEKYSGDIVSEAKLGDGKTMFTIKYSQKTAYRMGNANRGVAYKFDWNEIAAEDQGTKAKKLSNVTIAGKDCESYSFESSGITTTYAGWNNICLFTEQKMKVGSFVSKAVSVEENAVIAPEKFQVPAGFEVK